MKHWIILFAFAFTGLTTVAQQTIPDVPNLTYANLFKKGNKKHFGFKAGYNIAFTLGSTPDFKPESKNGFMVAAFYSPKSKSGMGYRSEIVFSRIGFAFDENGNKEYITNDYIFMPHFTTVSITKFVQLQLGGQIGYLLRSGKTNNFQGQDSLLTDQTDLNIRKSAGAAGGIEIYPFKGLIVGGRFNYNFPLGTANHPVQMLMSFEKNAVVNLFVGYRF